MIVLDTTVLVYAKGQDHPFQGPCGALIEAIADGRIEATTSTEVIQEFVHVRARRRDRRDAVSLGRGYAELLSPLISISAAQLSNGLAIFEREERPGPFDAVLAASAAAADATALVSADAGFGNVDVIRHVVPDTAGVAELLA
ncbi:MAG: type II toxin-antitoxin system VapC family toxin [Solirubrobacterales bacterium]